MSETEELQVEDVVTVDCSNTYFDGTRCTVLLTTEFGTLLRCETKDGFFIMFEGRIDWYLNGTGILYCEYVTPFDNEDVAVKEIQNRYMSHTGVQLCSYLGCPSCQYFDSCD